MPRITKLVEPVRPGWLPTEMPGSSRTNSRALLMFCRSISAVDFTVTVPGES